MRLASIFVQWARPGSMSNHSKIVDTAPCLDRVSLRILLNFLRRASSVTCSAWSADRASERKKMPKLPRIDHASCLSTADIELLYLAGVFTTAREKLRLESS
jgi:hypothetical protein